jgi:hypothetical protein
VSKQVAFESLMGERLKFYGVENSVLYVSRGRSRERLAFEAVEDEVDGYRSMLKDVRQVPTEGKIFFCGPIASVTVEGANEVDGWRLVDVDDGHVWLVLGTDNSDEYYPSFRFEYRPKREQDR